MVRFFQNRMMCSQDVAKILADLCTVSSRDGSARECRHLPTGSPLSELLAYWSFAPMFDRIASECEQRALKFTLFVDDIGISGGEIPHEFIRSILAVIGSHGLRAHKTRLWIDRPACLTGAIIWRSQLRLPNRRHFAIAKNRQALKSADIESKSGAKLLSTTVGQCFEASQLVPNLKRVAKQLRLLDPLSGALAAKPSSSPLPQSQPSPNASEANDYFAKMLYDFGPRSVAGERRDALVRWSPTR